MGSVIHTAMESESKEVKTVKDSGIWTMKYEFLRFAFMILILIIFHSYFINKPNSQRRQCGKNICCSELNRLQSEIRWLKENLSSTNRKLQSIIELNNRRFNNQEEKFGEVEKNQQNYSIVLMLFLATIVIVFLFLWVKNKDGKGNTEKSSTSERTSPASRQLKNELVIANFTRNWSDVDEKLAASFLTDRSIPRKLIREKNDIDAIDAKLVFLFVKCNERHIILEEADDTSQLRRKTVEIIKNKGGKAVVIYMLHGDSRNLEIGELYSRQLESINRHLHPILQALSEEDCVISTYKELSEFQIQHLQKLCKEYLSSES